MVAIAYLGSSRAGGGSANAVVVYLTILASAASILTGLFLRLILCCVVGADRDDNPREIGTELDGVSPGFTDDDGSDEA